LLGILGEGGEAEAGPLVGAPFERLIRRLPTTMHRIRSGTVIATVISANMAGLLD